MDREVALESSKHLGLKYPANKGSVDLMFILDEASEDELYEKCERIVGMCEENGDVDSLIVETSKDQRNLLEIRSNVYTAYKENVADALDMAVPPGSVPDLLRDISEIAKKYDTISPAVGHIADGNIHNFLMLINGKLPDYLEDMRNEMYNAAIGYGGTVTAEHGTGKTREKHMTQQFTQREIEIMQSIKKSFDPNGILNPGTIVD